MADGYITITKVFDGAYYNQAGWWAYNKTMTINVNSDMVENYQENPDVKRVDESKGKTNWYIGFESMIIELLQVNSAITITGSIDDPSVSYTWDTTTLNGGISDTATSIILTSGTAFSSQGMIRIGDEFIFYTGKTSNTLTGCQRGFFDTTATAHVDTTIVTNRTESAEHKFAMLDFIKKHGGAVTLTWRNREISVYMNKFTVTDTKREDEGGSQDPTSFSVIINCFEAVLQ